MQTLLSREKKEWKSQIDDQWVRTGSNNVWDAIFMAFRDYRDATPSAQKNIITERTKISINEKPVSQLVDDIGDRFVELYKNKQDEEEIVKQFFYLVPSRLIASEIIPYIKEYVVQNNNDVNKSMLYNEILEKCCLLGNYRQKKKMPDVEDDISKDFDVVITKIFNELEKPISFDLLQEAMRNVEYHLIIISPTEEVLFDSRTWKEGILDSDYYNVVIILSHPDGSYDSIGRMSYTKDGHQKISRLFNYDDECIEVLRK